MQESEQLIAKHKYRLKACPFCNSKDVKLDYLPWNVQCQSCYALVSLDIPGHMIEKYPGMMRVIDRWNIRGGVQDETLFIRDYPTYEI